MAGSGVALAVHGGAGARSDGESQERQAAVERGLDAGWTHIGESALNAVVMAVRHLEGEPCLNAGLGACLNNEGEVELDAGVMEGAGLAVGAVGAVRDVRYPVELARHVMEHSAHVLMVADGASRYARSQGLEMASPSSFITDRRRRRWAESGDTVGAVARDRDGHVAVAVSTGGIGGKLPGRVGDSPLAGAGFYADDEAGAVCTTGSGEAFVRLCTSHRVIADLGAGRDPEETARRALESLRTRVQGWGGLILVTADGRIVADQNSGYMPWASAQGD